jgi:hypothetical protein
MSAPRIVLGGERTLVAAKNTVYQLWTEEMGSGMAFGTVGVVSLIPQTLLRSECASINFVICKEAGEEPFEFTGPMLATFKATNDIAVFAVKQTVMRFTYLIGIPIDALISWKPPSAATAETKEDGIIILRKLPDPDLVNLVPLVKTSTHDLPAMLDKLISHLPSMKAAKMRSIADIKKHGKVGYDTAVKVAADAGQLRARAAAKAKGTTGKGTGTESAAGGQMAAVKWDELKKELLALGDQNFALPFNQRYLVLHVNKDTMVPTSASFAKLKEELKYVLPSQTLELSCLSKPFPALTSRVLLSQLGATRLARS